MAASSGVTRGEAKTVSDGHTRHANVNKKRKADKNGELKDEIPKKAKQLRHDYTVAHFKVDVKDPNTTFTGIGKFVEVCRIHAQEEKENGMADSYDMAAEYCRSSPDCSELLRLLEDADKRSDGEVQLIYEALECILLRMASTDSRAAHWQSVASKSVVESVLGGAGEDSSSSTTGRISCLKRIYSSLSMARKSAHIKATLRLLTSIVVQGEWAAREFDQRFDLEHIHVLPLLGRRDSKDTADVRACVLQLIVGLLLHAPLAVLRHVLERRVLLSAIFTAMHTDTESSVQMLLTALLDQVITNPAITKTMKIRLFNENALRCLFGLYRWKGPGAWKRRTVTGGGHRRHKVKEGNEKMDDEEAAEEHDDPVNVEGLRAVRAVVHRLLLTLCCDLKHGINFHDKSVGTSGRNMNHVVGGLLHIAARRQQTLATAVAATQIDDRYDNEADLVDELIISILRVCPDQLLVYLTKLQESFSPRASTAWLRHTAFLCKLFSCLPIPAMTANSPGRVSAAKRVASATVLLLPPAAVMQHFQSALKKPELVVRWGALQLLDVLLRRAETVLRSAIGIEGGDGGELVMLLQEALLLRLPDFKTVSASWSVVLQGCGDEGALDDVSRDDGTRDGAAGSCAREASVSADYAALVLRVMEGYQAVLPLVMAESPLDVASLLHGVSKVKASGGAVGENVGIRLLRLLGSMKDFSVNTLRERGCDQKSAMHWLLQLVMASPAENARLHSESISLLSQLISRTGMFDGLLFELGIWLSCASHHVAIHVSAEAREHSGGGTQPSAAITEYIEKCLLMLISNPYPYLETVCQYSTSIGHDLGRGLPFSPLVVVAVRTLLQGDKKGDSVQKLQPAAGKGGSNDAAVVSFLDDVLLRLLGVQDDPRPLIGFYQSEASALCCQRTKHYCILLGACFSPSADVGCKEALGYAACEKGNHDKLSTANFLGIWHLFFDNVEAGSLLMLNSESAEQTTHILKDITGPELVPTMKQVLLGLRYVIAENEGGRRSGLVSYGFALVRAILKRSLELTAVAADGESFEQQEIIVSHDKETSDEREDGDAIQVLSDAQVSPAGRIIAARMLVDGLPPASQSPPTATLSCSYFPATMAAFLGSTLVRTWFPLPPACRRFPKPCAANAITAILLDYGGAVGANAADPALAGVMGELLAAVESAASVLAGNAAGTKRHSMMLRGACAVATTLRRSDVVSGVAGRLVECALGCATASLASLRYDCMRAIVASVTRGVTDALDDPSVVSIIELTAGRLAADVAAESEREAALDYALWLLDLFPTLRLSPATLFNSLQVVYNADAASQLGLTASTVVGRLLCNQLHHAAFGNWIKDVGKLRKEARARLSSIAAVYLKECRSKGWKDEAALQKLDKMYWSASLDRLMAGRPQTNCTLDVICGLCVLLRTDEERRQLCDNLSAAIRSAKASAACHPLWYIYTTAAEAVTVSSARKQYLIDVVTWWDSVTSSELTREVSQVATRILTTNATDADTAQVTSYIDKTFVSAVDGSWKAFASAVLRNHYDEADIMQSLSSYISKLYVAAKKDGNLSAAEKDCAPIVTNPAEMVSADVQSPKSVSAASLFAMLTGHSKFLSVVMTDSSFHHPCADAVLDMVLVLLRFDGSAARHEHFAVWLGAYNASLTLTDQRLLCLMQLYEDLGVATSQYRPFVWGQQAIERHCRDAGNAGKPSARVLSSDSPAKQVLQCLDAERMRSSAFGFPLCRRLRPDAAGGFLSTQDLGADRADCYDPAFVLPLLSFIFRPEQVVDARAVVQSRVLGYAFAALSSHHADVRVAAGHVLLSFRHHLEPARFAEKRQVLWLLTCTQDSIDDPGKKLSCVFTSYLIKMADVLLKPDLHVYGPLCKFLHLRPFFDTVNVPEFYKLFNSSDVEYKAERMWMLHLLEDGLRETADYRIYEKRYVFKLLLAFHDSNLSDLATKRQVLVILKKAAGLRSVALDLVRQHGLIAWLVATLVSASTDEHRDFIISILQCLWYAVVPAQAREKAGPTIHHATPEPGLKSPPASFVSEMAVAAKMALRSIQTESGVKNSCGRPVCQKKPTAVTADSSWISAALEMHDTLVIQRNGQGHFVQPSVTPN